MGKTSLFGSNQPHRIRRKEQSKVNNTTTSASNKIKKRQDQNQLELIDWMTEFKPRCVELLVPILQKTTKGTVTMNDCLRALAIDKWYTANLEKRLSKCKNFKIPDGFGLVIRGMTKIKFNKFLLNSSKEMSHKNVIENKITEKMSEIEQELS